jgi:hypothetical protein
VVLFEELGENEVFATSFFSSIFGRKISYLLNTLPYGLWALGVAYFSIDINSLREIEAKPIRENIASYDV